MSRPRICGSPCSATAPSSIVSSRSETRRQVSFVPDSSWWDWNLERERLLERSDPDRAAARPQAEALACRSESAAGRSARDFALNGERKIRGYRVAAGVDGKAY